MKVYFAWKQLKVDYSKNIWKEGNCGHGFVYLLLGYISVKKSIENSNSVAAGAHEVGKVWPKVAPNFPDIWTAWMDKLHMSKKVGLSTFKEIF